MITEKFRPQNKVQLYSTPVITGHINHKMNKNIKNRAPSTTFNIIIHI